MSILFSFCDAHWILPWILPFILGWFFGSRLLGGYKNRVRDLESTQLREQKRFEALETDLNTYKAKELESESISAESDFSFDEERARYKQEIADLQHRVHSAEANTGQTLENPALESEVDGLKSKIEELQNELAAEKNKPSKSSDEIGADVAPRESSRLSSGLTQAPEIATLRSRIAELEAELASTDNEGLRSKLTAVEAELALEKGKSYEQDEASAEEAPVVAQLRNKLLATEAELALSKGGTYEQKEISDESPAIASLRNKLLQTEAELALLKGNDYEQQELGTNSAATHSTELSTLRKKIAKLEKSLALQKGYNSITKKAALVEKKNAGKKAKKSKTKQASSKASKKEKATKKKKQKTGSKTIGKKAGAKAATKKSKKTGTKTKAKGAQKLTAKIKSKTGVKSSTKSAVKTKVGKTTGAKKAVSSSKSKPTAAKGKKPAKGQSKATKASTSKTSRLTSSAKFAKAKEGDLTIIEGIGPKTAAVLKRKGIKNWSDLAAKTPGQLKELLSSRKGLSHIDPSTWTRQAKLATGSHWTRLANLQDELDGGKSTKKSPKKKSISRAKSSKKSTAKAEVLNIQLNSKLKKTNYQLIEGIGPKMNQLLIKEGIKSWTDLASYSPGEIRALLDKHGDKYKILDVRTWSRQASYAAKGQWGKLIQYQKKDGSDSKAEKQLRSMGIIKSINKNDLKLIEGVGPKIESLLKKAGIKTLGDLSKASKTKLKKILNAAGARYGLADPTHWPKQASLANAGKMAELKKLQDSI